MLAHLQKNFAWRALFIAWLAAGTIFVLTNIILMPLILDIDGALVLRYVAALVMGTDVLVSQDIAPVIVGALVHYAFSFVFTLFIALVVHRWGLLVGIVGGAVIGLALYGVNLYTMTRWAEWFFAINSPLMALSHVVFGVVAGGVYELFDHYDEPLNPQEKSA